MSTIIEKLQSVETLRQSIQAKGKLSREVLQKIEYKLRLECNYHSNKIEGGTLTKAETRSVMVGNITVEGKSLKDIREMKGHDEAMKEIFRVGVGEKRLSEKRIKELHRKIIVAETPEQESEIGVWKTVGNHIINPMGEKYEFIPPLEVPDAIHGLLNRLNAGLDKIHGQDKDAPDPLLLAFEFHLKFLSIHPFADGNGRTARLLTNLILTSLGYPCFWVSEGSEKDAYNRFLADIQGYGGNPDLLYSFMAGLVERSLRLVLDAAEGRDLNEMDDWKKEVSLLKNSLPQEDVVTAMRTAETIKVVYEGSIKPTITRIMRELSVYDELFLQKQMGFGPGSTMSVISPEQLDHAFQINPGTDLLHFNCSFIGFKKAQGTPFNVTFSLIWKLNSYHYLVLFNSSDAPPQLIKPYGVFYEDMEMDEIVRQCGKWVLDKIKENTFKYRDEIN